MSKPSRLERSSHDIRLDMSSKFLSNFETTDLSESKDDTSITSGQKGIFLILSWMEEEAKRVKPYDFDRVGRENNADAKSSFQRDHQHPFKITSESGKDPIEQARDSLMQQGIPEELTPVVLTLMCQGHGALGFKSPSATQVLLQEFNTFKSATMNRMVKAEGGKFHKVQFNPDNKTIVVTFESPIVFREFGKEIPQAVGSFVISLSIDVASYLANREKVNRCIAERKARSNLQELRDDGPKPILGEADELNSGWQKWLSVKDYRFDIKRDNPFCAPFRNELRSKPSIVSADANKNESAPQSLSAPSEVVPMQSPAATPESVEHLFNRGGAVAAVGRAFHSIGSRFVNWVVDNPWYAAAIVATLIVCAAGFTLSFLGVFSAASFLSVVSADFALADYLLSAGIGALAGGLVTLLARVAVKALTYCIALASNFAAPSRVAAGQSLASNEPEVFVLLSPTPRPVAQNLLKPQSVTRAGASEHQLIQSDQRSKWATVLAGSAPRPPTPETVRVRRDELDLHLIKVEQVMGSKRKDSDAAGSGVDLAVENNMREAAVVGVY